MAVTSASLIARFPEFAQAPSGLIDGSILDAQRQIDSEVYGAKYDSAVLFLAAHLIANNPLGEYARLVAKDGSTTYSREYDRLKRGTAAGWRVI